MHETLQPTSLDVLDLSNDSVESSEYKIAIFVRGIRYPEERDFLQGRMSLEEYKAWLETRVEE